MFVHTHTHTHTLTWAHACMHAHTHTYKHTHTTLVHNLFQSLFQHLHDTNRAFSTHVIGTHLPLFLCVYPFHYLWNWTVNTLQTDFSVPSTPTSWHHRSLPAPGTAEEVLVVAAPRSPLALACSGHPQTLPPEQEQKWPVVNTCNWPVKTFNPYATYPKTVGFYLYFIIHRSYRISCHDNVQKAKELCIV